MAVVVAQARRLGLKRFAVQKQGNVRDSLLRYALGVGLELVVARPRELSRKAAPG